MLKQRLADRRGIAATAALAVVALGLAACGSGGGSTGGGEPVAASSCTNKVVHADAKLVTLWAWYPGFEGVVDEFNNAHNDIQVCWTNAGAAGEEYTKFSTAIEAGKGAPDVIMLEADLLPSFTIRNALVDLASYGAGDVKANYTEGAWKDVSSGDAVYAIPVDGGPMGMLYRQDIFDQYGVKVPTTWDEFATAAQQLKDAGYTGKITNFAPNGRAFNLAMYAQAGSKPFTYSTTNPTDIGITVNDAGAKKVLSYWNDLIAKKLVATDDSFTADSNSKLVDGSYAVYLAAAWGPGYLEGLAGAQSTAQWRAAPMPQWKAGDDVQINWGGSAFAVTNQAKDPATAAVVAKEIFSTEAAWNIGIDKGALFPLWKPILESTGFAQREYPFFGGQKINEDVFLAAAAGYKGVTISPFQNYVFDQQTEVLTAMAQGKISSDAALDSLQDRLVKYAKEQGFSVK